MPNRIAYSTIALILCIIAFAVTACNRQGSPSMVLLNESTAPCWFDICPGTTNKADAISKLARVPFVDASTIVAKSDNTPGSYIHWRFKPEVLDFGRIYYRNDTVSYVSIDPRPEEHLTFQDIVAEYGTPEYVWAYSDWADSRWLYIALAYRNQGLFVVSFDADWQNDEPANISERTPVTEVIFFEPTRFEDLMTEFEGANWLGAGLSINDIMLRLQPWQGYGEVNVVTRPP